MLTENQLKIMLNMQEKMNKTIDPLWFNNDPDVWNFYRASYIEAGEAVEHHGWKWWKKQTKDLPQLQMELIDIWHFYLSTFIQKEKGDLDKSFHALNLAISKSTNTILFDNKIYQVLELSTLQKLDLLVGLNTVKRIEFGLFFALMEDCELSTFELNRQYITKNALNIFRQDNGYKEGTYHKSWFDQEDNVFLVEESKKLDSSHDNYAEQLLDSLKIRYQEALSYFKNKS